MNKLVTRNLSIAVVIAAFVAVSGCRQAAGPAVRAPLEFKDEPVPVQGTVRIGIRIDEIDATIASDGPINAREVKSGRVQKWPAGDRRFTVSKGILRSNGRSYPGAWLLTPVDPSGTIGSGKYSYRGTIVLKPTGEGKLSVINELGIDDYLKGVLPRETVPVWSEEALKAQAVASRTYLASHLSRHADKGFDLCDLVHCQVYGGATKEHPRTNAAVDGTPGQILLHEGKPIGAFFSANCGGSTEGILAVWGTPDRAYLRPRRCPWGTGAPWYEWRRTMNDNEIMSALKAKGMVKGSVLKSISITRKGPSGRASTMAVRTDAGTFTMLGNDFRIACHPEKIRSTLFTRLARLKGGYLFVGRGWGHGVGLCQWGAKGMAEKGRDYRDILSYYYPHTTLAIWSRQ